MSIYHSPKVELPFNVCDLWGLGLWRRVGATRLIEPTNKFNEASTVLTNDFNRALFLRVQGMERRNDFTVRKLIRDQLRYKLHPLTRSHLHRWLVEEEDKLGRDLELLTEVEKAIENFNALIATQIKIVAALERDGRHDRVARESALLDGLKESQVLHQKYYNRLRGVILK